MKNIHKLKEIAKTRPDQKGFLEHEEYGRIQINKKEKNMNNKVSAREICWNCGRSVAFRSGRFVNRIPSLDSEEIKREYGAPYPEGGYLCFECETGFKTDDIRCPKCGAYALVVH